MTFKRKIYQQLLSWKAMPNKNSALLIEGARRVGKTTVVQEFAKSEYRDFIYIDFTYAPDETKKLFSRIRPFDQKSMDLFFADLFVNYNKELHRGDLIIFDEVQNFPIARQAIKALVQDGRFDYIETGSLISIRENTLSIQIPSEEKRIEMYPMDFEEFKWALGDETSCKLLREMLKQGSVSQSVHQKMMDDYRLYLSLGGMPKVVASYLENGSFFIAAEEKKNISELYVDDLRKHDNSCQSESLAIYLSSFASLRSWSKRTKTGIRDESTELRYIRSLGDLEDSRMVNAVYRTADLSFGNLVKDRTMFKLYPLDAGLMLNDLLGEKGESSQEAYRKIRFGSLAGANYGLLYECAVAEALKANGHELYYHVFESEKGTRHEIDFVSYINGRLSAIEVKSTNRFTVSSLDALTRKYPQLKIDRIVVSPKPLSRSNNVLYLPLYLTYLL